MEQGEVMKAMDSISSEAQQGGERPLSMTPGRGEGIYRYLV